MEIKYVINKISTKIYSKIRAKGENLIILFFSKKQTTWKSRSINYNKRE